MLGVEHEVKVVSAHRTPKRLYDYASSAKDRGLKLIIAGAGGAAHLPGMAASMTSLPVLGVPVESQALKGMDSLLSIVQMPAGVPVGTLAIGQAGAVNAGLLAASILATNDEALAARVEQLSRGANRKRWPKLRNDRAAGLDDRHRRRRPARPDAQRRRGPARLQMPYLRPARAALRRRRRGGIHARQLMTIALRCEAFGAEVDVVTYEFENLPVDPLRVLGDKLRPGTKLAGRRAGPCGREAVHRGMRRRGRAMANASTVWKTCRERRPGASEHRSCSRPAATATTARARPGSVRPAKRKQRGTRSASEPAVAEAGVDFAAEFSVIVARWADGRTTFWDSPDNVHRDGILRTSTVPSG